MKYLTISDFARLSGLNRKTLIYYDRIGLLKPRIYGENGYRYYDFQQIDESYSIQTLRMLGVSLESIKEYLSSMSTDRAEALFTAKLKELDIKQREIESLRYYLKDRLTLIHNTRSLSLDNPFIESLTQDENYIQSPQIIPSNSSIYATEALGLFYEALIETDLFLAYNVALHTQTNKTSSAIFTYLMRITDSDAPHINIVSSLSFTTRHSGIYLSMYYSGDMYANCVQEARIEDYAKAHAISIDTTFIHETIADEIISLNENERISKISVRIVA